MMLKYSRVWRAELICIAEHYTPRKNWIYRALHLLRGVPPSCHFQLDWILLCLTLCAIVKVSPVAFLCEAVLAKLFQWCSNVGYSGQSFPSGIPVWDSFTSVLPVVFQCVLGQPVISVASHCTLAQHKGIISCLCSEASAQPNEAETKWPPHRRRHFKPHFLEWKCKNFD